MSNDGEFFRRHAEGLFQEILAERPFDEDELDVEGGFQVLLDRRDLVVGEALGAQAPRVDCRGLAERAVADGVSLDLRDLGRAVAKRMQGVRHGAVDDLEVAAASELLEFHQGEVRLDAGGVAIHHEARARARGGLRRRC